MCACDGNDIECLVTPGTAVTIELYQRRSDMHVRITTSSVH